MGPFNDLSYNNYTPYTVSPSSPSGDSFNPLPFAASLIPYVGPIISAFANGIIANNQQSRMNRYNDPVNQMARLRRAGINPYSAFNQISAQNQSAPVTPVQVHLDNIFDNMSKFMQLSAMQEDIKGKQLNNGLLDNQLRFQNESYRSRFQQLLYQEVASKLQNDLSRGRITYQQYANHMKQLDDRFLTDYSAYTQNGDVSEGDEADDWLQSTFGDWNFFSPRMLKEVYIPLKSQIQSYINQSKMAPDVREAMKKRLGLLDKQIESIDIANKHNKFQNSIHDTTGYTIWRELFEILRFAFSAGL